MALLFWRDDASHDAQTDALFADKASISPAAVGVLLSLVAYMDAARWASDEIDRVERRMQSYIRPVQRRALGP
jgi:hypothetical protein